MWILSWWIVGRAALEGRLDRGWLIAWALLLLALIPLELVVTWLQGRVAIDGGALRPDPEEIRHEGAGRLLGRVIEAQAIESLALGGGLLALVAILELAMAAVVLAAAGAWLPVLLALWVGISAVLTFRYFTRRGTWTELRLAVTHDLVERIVGQRTRLAQQTPDAWHDGEDQAVERYVAASRLMDRAFVWLMTVGPRGWLLIGNLRVYRGDRLLLQGPSGSGKSTLASLLTGLRRPGGGLLLFDGVDRQTLGADPWRRRIVAAPQFHENHVFMGTFAFNALMGSEWSATFQRA